ncbi:fibronectin type III domain-containing protein [Gracilimonas sediminicola]|uniref:Fibronectin type III domain-containing protein n=1 Tax=Gracilimonas sediminicola TaxID=2952158 RepID=A0A9X2L492_9BACT|nr:fibronectin type III domain-containing protein [Gracilimonas sediminicola]MCP9291483.1 fibronectin type III domain-containing protein [Gracilimonas sediminicola]
MHIAKITVLMAFICMVIQGLAFSQGVLVSAPDTLITDGSEVIEYPLEISNLSPDSLLGFTFVVQYDSEVVSIVDHKNTDLSKGFFIQHNPDNHGLYRITGANSHAIHEDGILIKLIVEVIGEGTSSIIFEQASINEGNPELSISNGEISVSSYQTAPKLIAPFDGQENISEDALLKWSSNPLYASYEVQYSSNSSLNPVTSYNDVQDTSIIIQDLDYNTQYYWRVRAINKAGSSNWSEVRSFTTTVQEPTFPELTSPFNESENINLSPELTWSESERADTYVVQLDESDNFSSLIKEDTTSTTSLQLEDLDYLTKYYWRVKALNTGGESDWSNTFSFTTIIEDPDMASLLFPENHAADIDTLVTMVWSEADRAESFRVQLSESNSFASLAEDKTISDTVLSVGGLDFSTTYYWRVKSINAGGVSEWTAGNQFTTGSAEAGTPSLLSPSNNSTNLDTALTFTWRSAEHAIEYEIQVSENINFGSLVKQNASASDTSVTFKGFDFDTRYYWRVRAFAENTTSGWSSTFNFITTEKQNEPPFIQNAIGPLTLFEDFGVESVVNLDSVFGDHESETLVYDIQGELEVVEVSISDSDLILSSIENVYGSEEIMITASDEGGETINSVVEVTITAVNDLPYFVEIPDTVRFKSGEEYEFVYGDLVGDVEDRFSDLSFDYTLNPEEIDVQFSATDKSLTFTAPDYTGEVLFTLKVTDLDGGTAEAKIVIVVDDIITSSESIEEIPTEFSLSQNYPNPFNPTTQITYQLPNAAAVSFRVYDMTGREVYSIINQQKSAGEHTVKFDASNLSSGIYIYQLKAGSFIETKRMTLIK